MSKRRRALEVREADERDVAGVRSCLLAAFEPYRGQYSVGGFEDTVPRLPQLLTRIESMTILVVEALPGDIVGTIAYEVRPSGDGHLRGMAVRPDEQSRGLAASLLSAAERQLAGLGCDRVVLETTEPLQQAIGFYERHGYRPTGTVGDFYGMRLLEYSKSFS